MATGDDFQGIATYAATQNPNADSGHQPQRQELPGVPPFAVDGADFAPAARRQFVKTDFSRQSNVVEGSSGL